MKKIIGYGVVYLFGLICVLGMIFRTDSLEDNIYQNNYKSNNVYILNE